MSAADSPRVVNGLGLFESPYAHAVSAQRRGLTAPQAYREHLSVGGNLTDDEYLELWDRARAARAALAR